MAVRVLRALVGPGGLRDRLQDCTTAIVDLTGAAFARIWTLEPGSETLVLQASSGMYTHLDGEHGRIPVGRYKIGRIAARREPHLTNDVLHDNAISDPAWARREGMKAFAGYPLIAADRLVGVVAMFAREPMPDAILSMLGWVADSIAWGVEREWAERDREALLGELGAQHMLLDAVIRQMPAGVVVSDVPSGAPLLVNDQVEALLGARLEFDGVADIPRFKGYRPDGTPYGDDQWPLVRAMAGESIEDEEIHLELSDGSRGMFAVSAAPVRDADGQIVAVVSTFYDLRDRVATQRRLAAQHAVSSTLVEATSFPAAAGPILRAVCENLGWDVGCLWVIDPQSNVLRCVESWSSEDIDTDRFIELSRDNPFGRGEGLPGRVWRDAEPIWLTDVRLEADFKRGDAARTSGLASALGVPLIVGGEVRGCLEFFRRGAERPDRALLDALASTATQVGQFIERWRVDQLVRASEARKAAMLASAIDAVISVDSAGRIIEFNPAAEAIFGYEREEVVGRSIAEAIIPPSLRGRHAAAFERYVRTREASILDQRVELVGLRKGGDEFPLEITVTHVPLPGPPIFTAYLRDITERKQTEQALVEERGRFAELARTLQASLLPPSLPELPGVETAAVYLPAGEGTDVGGDFYDVFETERGRWQVVVGDVCGKGAEAAAVTALARYTIRAAALGVDGPMHLLATLNEALRKQRPDRFCTVAVARIAPGGGAAGVTVSVGGHPLPLLRTAEGTVTSVGQRGTLLGVFDRPDLHETRCTARSGDLLLLYTDGVVEARSPRGMFGDRRLSGLVSSLADASAADTVAAIESAVREWSAGPLRDDVAVVALRVL